MILIDKYYKNAFSNDVVLVTDILESKYFDTIAVQYQKKNFTEFIKPLHIFEKVYVPAFKTINKMK